MATVNKIVSKKLEKKNLRSSIQELESYSKEELITRVQQLEAHAYQLRNIIQKSTAGTGSASSQSCKKSRPFDFSKHHTRHVLLKFLYLGWDYQGYAVQEDSAQTIEHQLFEALHRSCLIQNRESSNYHRCGRTDKGVSAFSQVISLDIRSSLSPETQNQVSKELPYCKILNRLLPDEIRVIAWSPAPCATTSARFDCSRRSYRYFFPRGNLNIKAMQEAVSYLPGLHDFRNLCKMDVGNGVVDFIRSIFHAKVTVVSSEKRSSPHNIKDTDESVKETTKWIYAGNSIDELCSKVVPLSTSVKCNGMVLKPDSLKEVGPCLDQDGAFSPSCCSSPYDLCELVITGKAFLWHQIRCIASVLFLIGSGHESPDVIKILLDPSKCPTKPQYSLASEVPLCLFECNYDIPLDWYLDQEEITRLVGQLQKCWTTRAIKTEMIRQMLQVLETELPKPVCLHSSSLIQGVQAKVYQPLLQRKKCSSLENRIEHYVKKRKLEVITGESSSHVDASFEAAD